MKSNLYKEYEDYHKKISRLSEASLSDLELVAITSATNAIYNPRLKDQKITNKKPAGFKKTLTLFRDFLYLLLSMPGIAKLYFSNNVSIVWSGDFYDDSTQGDFRLGNFYKNADKEKLKYIEFITSSNYGFLKSFKNYFRRKRLIIFFDAISRIFKLFQNKEIDLENFDDFCKEDQKIIYENISNILATYKFLEIFKPHAIKNIFLWEISSRTSGIFYWAKKNNIKTIGIMHGLPIKEYMYYETMPGLVFKDHLRLDTYGVWSEYWKNYYEENSTMFDCLEVSGPLRAKGKFSKSQGTKILLLIEPLLDTKEIDKYASLINSFYDKITIKVRSDFRPEQLNKYYECMPNLQKCMIESGSIEELLKTEKFGYFIATHSTAIQDCLHFGLRPILLSTSTWGNYLNIEEKFICKNQDDIKLCFNKNHIYNNEIEELAYRFSRPGDGSKWIVKKLKL